VRLSAFNAKLAGGFLVFDCPSCAMQYPHRIRVPIAPTVFSGFSWQSAGTFPETFTVTPSIDAGCWHGNITNGELITVG
jgi:hypothetical protein